MLEINEQEQIWILIFAFRYALGRESTAPSIVCDVIKRNWNNLTEQDRVKIKSEIQHYDSHNGFSKIDRPTWMEVMDLERS